MWTKEQSQTIEQRDKNILVSAAAGAGKTAGAEIGRASCRERV